MAWTTVAIEVCVSNMEQSKQTRAGPGRSLLCCSEMTLPTRQPPSPLQNHPRLEKRISSAFSPISGPADQPKWCLQESLLLCWDATLSRPLSSWIFSQGFCGSLSGHMFESICRSPAGRNASQGVEPFFGSTRETL